MDYLETAPLFQASEDAGSPVFPRSRSALAVLKVRKGLVSSENEGVLHPRTSHISSGFQKELDRSVLRRIGPLCAPGT